MKSRTLGLAVAGALFASLAAADLPGQTETKAVSEVTPAQRGDVLVARRSWSSARDAYVEALRSSAALHNKLGICYQHLGEPAKARAEYQKALELREDYAEAWNNLGTLDHAQHRYDQAIVSYERAIALNPTDAVFRKNLGSAWLALEDVEKALGHWSEALRLDPAVLTDDAGSVPAGEVDLARQYYLFAKLIASRGDVPMALELLGLAREYGFRDFAEVERDPDFQAVVQDPRWAGLTR